MQTMSRVVYEILSNQKLDAFREAESAVEAESSSPHLLVFEGQPIFEPHGQNLIGSARYYFLI